MNLEQLLAELRLDPSFAQLPADWQSSIANEILSGGLNAGANWGRGSTATPLTIANIPQLRPELMAEYNRVRGLGDTRTWDQWAAAHSQVDPTWLPNLQYLAPQDAAAVSGTPEQNAALEAWRQKATQYSNLGTETVPLEQDLLGRVVESGYADWENDALRQKQAQDLLSKYEPIFTGARNTIGSIYDGSLLQSEYAANAEAAAAQRAALDSQMAQRRAALEAAVQKMYESQTPINDARITNAGSQAAAINLAAQAERDRVMANFAQDGYVGGSSGTDAELFRASLAGRQGAAQALGDAKLANATDLAGISRYGATETRGLADYGAQEGRLIADSEAQRKLGFFSNDISRRLAGLSLPSASLQSEFGARTMADDYGQSGFSRFMDNLNRFRTSGTPAPTAQTATTTATDSGYENLGAGLLAVAGNIGNANKWWSSPTTATTKSTAPSWAPI